jgi:AP-3 complex subunit mu
MLDSFLDYGYPLIPQKFVLESIAKPSGVMEKIEEVIVGRQNI